MPGRRVDQIENATEYPPGTDHQCDQNHRLQRATENQESEEHCQRAGDRDERASSTRSRHVRERTDDLDDSESEQLDRNDNRDHEQGGIRPREYRDTQAQCEDTEQHRHAGEYAASALGRLGFGRNNDRCGHDAPRQLGKSRS